MPQDSVFEFLVSFCFWRSCSKTYISSCVSVYKYTSHTFTIFRSILSAILSQYSCWKKYHSTLFDENNTWCSLSSSHHCPFLCPFEFKIICLTIPLTCLFHGLITFCSWTLNFYMLHKSLLFLPFFLFRKSTGLPKLGAKEVFGYLLESYLLSNLLSHFVSRIHLEFVLLCLHFSVRIKDFLLYLALPWHSASALFYVSVISCHDNAV